MHENWNRIKEQFLADIEKNAGGSTLADCLGLDAKHNEREEPIFSALGNELFEKQPSKVSDVIAITLKHSPSLGEFAFFLALILRKLEQKRSQRNPLHEFLQILEGEV